MNPYQKLLPCRKLEIIDWNLEMLLLHLPETRHPRPCKTATAPLAMLERTLHGKCSCK